MENPKELKYSKDHEWVLVEGNQITVGITYHAQEQLSDVVYVELPEVDDELEKGDVFATVESVKAASDCCAPASGRVVEVNESLEEATNLVNEDPFGEGWFMRMKIDDPADLDDLMDADAYTKFCEEEED